MDFRNRYLNTLLWLLLAHASALGQSFQSRELDVFTLGNITQIQDAKSYAQQLADLLKDSPQWTLVLNGDLTLQGESFDGSLGKLDTMITVLSADTNGQVILLPGDKDWANGSRDGLAQVKKLEKFVHAQDYSRVYLPVQDGCPGPNLFPAGDNLRLLLLNTQWVNHRFIKPTSESAQCDVATEETILEEIEGLIDDNGQANVMVIGHHPLLSHSRVGGTFPFHDWLLPIPGIGLFTTSYRQNIGTRRDIVNAQFDDFRQELDDILSEYGTLIYASAHAENIELFRRGNNVYINSGSPQFSKYVRPEKSTIFASRSPGIVQIRYLHTGEIETFIHHYDTNNGFSLQQSASLFQAPCLEPVEDLPINNRLIPCHEHLHLQPVAGPTQGTVVKAASLNYHIGKMAKKFLGQHYRDSWTTPIEVPVLDLNIFAGGLSPLEVGGGRQTKSLKFESNNGYKYVFRSVDKDPSKALARDLRGTIISLLIGDQTTTQQPYGALPTSKMLDHLDILHARPQLYVMPNSERLGHFNAEFSGMMGLIEERPTDPDNKRGFADAVDVKRSLNLFRRMYRDRDIKIAIPEFVRARIFDMLVGDWGKHEDNWKWAGFKDETGLLYRPIPRDRDHVFSRWDGLLPWLVDREWAKPSGEDFDFEIRGLRSLMWQARHLDRFVASEADKDMWLRQAQFIQANLDSQKIDEAIRTLPQEIIDIDGGEIGNKLKSRLNDLDTYAEKYYLMLAKQVDVVGSNKHERFEVHRKPSGEVNVQMFKIKKGKKDIRYYNRLFDPDETKEIRLFGMDGRDQFVIDGYAKHSIPVHIIPGTGKDSITDRSQVKGVRRLSILYPEPTDVITGGNELMQKRGFSYDHFRYDRTGFSYNTYFPIVYLFFSTDQGISLNANVLFTRQKFGKPDFASTHEIGSSISSIGNIRVSYDGTWRHVVANLDLIGGLSYQKKKRYRYFFGLGHGTEYDPALLRDDFYTLQYSSAQAYLGLQRSFWKHSHIHLASLLELNSGQKLANTILEDIDILGEQNLNIAKIKFELDLDFRDQENLPQRGARFFTNNQLASPLKGEKNTYIVGESRIEYFLSVLPFTLGLRGGWLYSHRAVPYYDLPTLGQNRYLRGFRRNRFSGRQAAFMNSELRVVFRDKPKAMVPHKLGFRVFFDQARVNLKDEKAHDWHQGYGLGVFYVPIRERFSLHLSFAFSKEEQGLVLFGFGNSF